MNIKNKKILIVGFGLTGKGALNLALSRGALVSVFDDNQELFEQSDERKKFSADKEIFKEKWDWIVISPGIDLCDDKYLVIRDSENLISEIDFSFLLCKNKSIAITGTNGKSTTTALIAHFLNQSNIKASPCGNFGVSVAKLISQDIEDLLVVELSSFQLDTTKYYIPDIVVCLDITEDHLNRYKSFQEYRESKLNFIKKVFNKGFSVIVSEATYNEEKWLRGNNVTKVNQNFCRGEVNISLNGSLLSGDINADTGVNKNFSLKGYQKSNLLSALAGVILISKDIDCSMNNFTPLRFRHEKIYINNELIAVNDSKSSSSDSCLKALEAIDEKKILLLGGRNKKLSFHKLCHYLEKNKIKVVVFGESAAFFENLLSPKTKVFKAGNLKEAVGEAVRVKEEKEVIVFSPGCESFDEFNSYYDRGEQFEKNLKEFYQAEIITAC